MLIHNLILYIFNFGLNRSGINFLYRFLGSNPDSKGQTNTGKKKQDKACGNCWKSQFLLYPVLLHTADPCL